MICSAEVDFHQCLRRAGLIWLLIIIQHLYLSGVWFHVDLKGTPKVHVFKGNWTMSSKCVNHLRCNCQLNWGILCDYFIRKRDFTLIMNKIFI